MVAEHSAHRRLRPTRTPPASLAGYRVLFRVGGGDLRRGVVCADLEMRILIEPREPCTAGGVPGSPAPQATGLWVPGGWIVGIGTTFQ